MGGNESFKSVRRDKKLNSDVMPPMANRMEAVIGNQSALSLVQSKNVTGIPDGLKQKVEKKSGLSMDDVTVHYNSNKPASVQAYAYTQGTKVYVAPGQERHLAHELGHVVQQKQGRVHPTGYVNGQPLNNSSALEHEADSYR